MSSRLSRHKNREILGIKGDMLNILSLICVNELAFCPKQPRKKILNKKSLVMKLLLKLGFLFFNKKLIINNPRKITKG
tara:strand:- start:3811 stop:4044 length:234 start_codon:yes stop_codon:yes gene_type:complete